MVNVGFVKFFNGYFYAKESLKEGVETGGKVMVRPGSNRILFGSASTQKKTNSYKNRKRKKIMCSFYQNLFLVGLQGYNLFFTKIFYFLRI